MPHAQTSRCSYCQEMVEGFTVQLAQIVAAARTVSTAWVRQIPAGGSGHKDWCFAQHKDTALRNFTSWCPQCNQVRTEGFVLSSWKAWTPGQGHFRTRKYYPPPTCPYCQRVIEKEYTIQKATVNFVYHGRPAGQQLDVPVGSHPRHEPWCFGRFKGEQYPHFTGICPHISCQKPHTEKSGKSQYPLGQGHIKQCHFYPAV
jgi:hypothetical protein